MKILLEVKNLKVHYGRAEVLKGISITINEKEIVTLIGTNGAGKTTTLRAISGLKKPTDGEIWFHEARIDTLPGYKIVQLGIAHVPEGRIVFAPMTVFDNLKMGAYLRRDKRKVAKDLEEMYEHFPVLRRRREQKAGSLSGGEQQMLAIARALMAKPRLLLMDEPSMGLSPILVDEVSHIISDINRRGITIILVEQNAHMALSLAKRAFLLEVGNIVLEGAAKEMEQDSRVIEAYLGGD